MPMTMTRPEVNGRPIQFVASAGFNDLYGGIEAAHYVKLSLEILQKYPYDMLIFEMPDEEHLRVRLAGYHLLTEELNETKVVFKTTSLKIRTFWLKIDRDENGDYIGTFLFPDEY
jgi:uncharacterized protein YfaT (DUF1175 family)